MRVGEQKNRPPSSQGGISGNRGNLDVPNWSNATSVTISFLIVLFLALVAAGGALTLQANLQDMPNPWLPEVVRLLVSVDTRVQRSVFLITAVAFAAILSVALFLRPPPPPWLDRLGKTLCLNLDPILLASVLRRWSITSSPWLHVLLSRCLLSATRRFALGSLVLCLAISAIIFALGQYNESIFTGPTLLKVAVSDSHIYAIFGKAGETLAGRFASDPTSKEAAYGFGSTAIYALGRYLGVAGGYFYAYQIARWSNLVAVVVLLCGLFWPQARRPGYFSTILLLLAAECTAIPLLFPNGNSTYTANLAGLRYVPMFLFIVSAGVMPLQQGWTSRFSLAVFAALGFVYSADVGIISMVAYVAYVALEQGSISTRLLRVFSFLTAMILVIIAFDTIIRITLAVNLLSIVGQITATVDNNFGGVLVKFDILNLILIVLFVVTTSFMVFSSIDRALEKEERFVAAISIMGFVWYSYYLHRPSRLYWIYPYLALFPLRYWMGRVSNWSTGESRIGAVLTLCVALLITQQTIGGVGRGFAQERAKRHDTQAAALSTFSGIKVDATFADIMNARVQVLDRLGTADAMVITGFPYAMSVASKIATPPRDIVFSMTTTQDIDALVASILAQRPSRLFLEPPDTPAWGPDLMRTVVNRIEKRISGHYTRSESISEWRVWTVNP